MLLKHYHEAVFPVLRSGLEYLLHPWEIQAETWIDLTWVDLPRGEDIEWIRWWWIWELWATQDKLCLQCIFPQLCALHFLLPCIGHCDAQFSTLTVQNQWDPQLEGTSNLSNLIPTHKATALSCHPHPSKGSVSLCWTTCRDKKLTTCKDTKTLSGALL